MGNGPDVYRRNPHEGIQRGSLPTRSPGQRWDLKARDVIRMLERDVRPRRTAKQIDFYATVEVAA